jgi:hypothetical protein
MGKDCRPGNKKNASFKFKSPSQLLMNLREYNKLFENILIINTFKLSAVSNQF